MPVSKDYDCDARNSREYIERTHTARCGECDDEEAKNYGNPLGHVEQGVLDWAEHGEDDGHADDVVDGVEHTGENHQNMV